MAVRISAESQTFSRTVSLGSQPAYSVGCWLRLAADRNTWSTGWCLGNASAGDVFAILQTSSTGTNLEFITSASFTAVPIVNMAVGTWYYVAVSMNGATGTAVYRTPTTAVTSVAITGQGAIDQATWQLGRSIYNGEWLNGNLTAVKWWGTNLTAAELERESWTYQPHRTEGLRAWHPLLSPETADYSGAGTTLTGGSGATTEDGPPIPWGSTVPRLILPSVSAVTHEAQAAATAAATLTGAASATRLAAASRTVTATRAGAATVAKPTAGTVSASGALAAAAQATKPAATVSTVTASRSAAASAFKPAAAMAATTATQTADAAATKPAAASLQGTASMQGAMAGVRPAGGAVAATAHFGAEAAAVKPVDGALQLSAVLAAAVEVSGVQEALAEVSVTAALSATVAQAQALAGAVAVEAELVADGEIALPAAVALAATAGLAGTAEVARHGSAGLTVSAAMAGAATVVKPTTATLILAATAVAQTAGPEGERPPGLFGASARVSSGTDGSAQLSSGTDGSSRVTDTGGGSGGVRAGSDW